MSEENKNLIEDENKDANDSMSENEDCQEEKVKEETTEDEDSEENEDGNEENKIEDDKRKKKQQIIFISILLIFVIVLFVAAFITDKKEAEKQNELYSVKYESAEKYLNEGQYDEAISVFYEISEYRDSNERIVEVQNLKTEKLIKDAQKIYDSGDKMKAYKMLSVESENEKVAAVLEKYKKALIADAEAKVFWVDDDMSDERLIRAKTEIDNWVSDTKNLIIHVYYWHTEDGNKKIMLRVLFADETEGYGFIPPVHPTDLKFKSDKGEIDFSVNFMNTKFEPLTFGSGWKEDIYVELSLEEANSLAKLFKDSDKVRIRAKGIDRHIDFTMSSKDAEGIIDIVDYINVVSEFGV